MTSDDTKIRAIAANLEVLRHVLAEASNRADDALAAILDNEVNGAIGAVDGLDYLLSQAIALHGAARALHRGR